MVKYKGSALVKRRKSGPLFHHLWHSPSDLSKLELNQTWWNWISHQSKNVTIKSSHIYRKDRNEFLIFLDQICQKWIKVDPTFGQKWIFGSNGFSAESAFLPIILLSNLKWLFGQKCFFQINLPYFSKYWKVWLAFDGWKLSGLFYLDFCFLFLFGILFLFLTWLSFPFFHKSRFDLGFFFLLFFHILWKVHHLFKWLILSQTST